MLSFIQFIAEEWKPIHHTLTPEQKADFASHAKSFTRAHKLAINAYKHTSKDLPKRLGDLNHVTGRKIGHALDVYRGFHSGAEHGGKLLHHLPVGHEFTLEKHTGTSLNPEYASEYAPDNTAHIHVPAGSRGHFLDAGNKKKKYDYESEFLLHPNTKVQVVGHTKHHTQVFNPSTGKNEHSHYYITHLHVMPR
jgi:hypothetical protein